MAGAAAGVVALAVVCYAVPWLSAAIGVVIDAVGKMLEGSS